MARKQKRKKPKQTTKTKLTPNQTTKKASQTHNGQETVSPAQWLCQSSLLGHSTLTALTDALLEVQTDKSAKYCVRHILLFPTLSKWEEEKKTQTTKYKNPHSNKVSMLTAGLLCEKRSQQLCSMFFCVKKGFLVRHHCLPLPQNTSWLYKQTHSEFKSRFVHLSLPAT